MFHNVQKSRVFTTMGKDKPLFGSINEAIDLARGLGYIYLLWDSRVFDIQGYDTGLKEKDLLDDGRPGSKLGNLFNPPVDED